MTETQRRRREGERERVDLYETEAEKKVAENRTGKADSVNGKETERKGARVFW